MKAKRSEYESNNRIVRALIRRDGVSQEEAEDILREVREMVEEAVAEGNYEEAEAIFQSELGLEIDYVIDMF